MDDRVQKELDELHLDLGRAVSAFSRVEKAIGDAYRACYSLYDQAVAMHSFLAVRDTSVRQAMASRAVFYSLNFLGNPDDLVARWRLLSTELRRLSELRNKLAHGEASYSKTVPYDRDFQRHIQPYAYMEPYADAANKYLKGNGASLKGIWAAENKAISIQELQIFLVDCHNLSTDLLDFSHDLTEALEQARSRLSEDSTPPA